jgi:hypothetical protein
LLLPKKCETVIEESQYVDIDDWPEGKNFTSAGKKDEEMQAKLRLM